jgi:hypothetical protein
MRDVRSRIVLASILCLSAFVLLPHAHGQTPEDALLNASNAEAGDAFGRSVAIDGDWAIVGTDFEDGPSDNTTHAGAAYVFERSGGTWQEVQVLRASNAGSGDEFGSSVAIDGDRAIVGAPYEEGPSDNTSRAGAAYVFERNGSTWQEVQILRASNLASDDQFGASVAIDGDRTIIGVLGENGPPNNLTFGGAAYVFEHSGSAWQQAQILRASNAGGGDAFGRSVAIDGDWAIVGADFEDGPSDNTTRAGAAYVFERTDSGWNANEDRILRASNANSED